MARFKHSPTSSSNEQSVQREGLDKQMAQQQSQGKPLPKGLQSEMEAVFGADFGEVRLHTGKPAVQMSEQLNAKAFTHQSDIFFNKGEFDPVSQSGKQLIAHELTHVSQQAESGPSIQRKKEDETVDQEALEAKLKADFQAIIDAVDSVPPGTKKGIPAVRSKIKTFQEEFAKFKPEWSLMDVHFLPAGAGYDDWKKWQIFDEYMANSLSAKLKLIGLDKESDFFFELGAPYTTVGTYPLAQKDTYFKAYAAAAVEKVDTNSASGRTNSLDFLIKAFKFIVETISELDYDEIKKDEELSSGFLGRTNVAELGFFGEWPFFMSLMQRLGIIYGGMQKVIQAQMDMVLEDLHQKGESDHIPEVFKSLEKIEKNIESSVIFLSELFKFRKNPPNGPDGKPYKYQSFYPIQAPVPVTRSEFGEKGGKHFDAFSQGSSGPALDLDYYDRDQDDGQENMIPIKVVHGIRHQQLAFILDFYGLNKKGKKSNKKQAEPDLMPEQSFDLNSIDDWRVFLDAKYEDLTANQGKNKADAFFSIIRILESYLKAFAISTPYNISEYGDNYLTRDFPRALTGQLVHDCGVFALKTIYMLSLIGEKLGLQMQYIVLPNHIGLIITGEQVPTLYVHNNNFNVVPLDEAQFDSLSEVNQQMVLSSKGLKAYKKARAEGNTDAFQFTEDKIKNAWLSYSQTNKIKGPKTDQQFHAEQAANLFISNVDMPFRLQQIHASSYSSSLSTDDIKSKLWKGYHKAVEGKALFNQRALDMEFEPTDQFNLRYLEITVQSKNFHNNVLLPFWNIAAHKLWMELKDKLKKHQTANDKDAYLQALKTYEAAFSQAALEVFGKFGPIDRAKERIHEIIEDNRPSPINPGISRTIGERSVPPFWKNALNGHNDALQQRIQNLENDTENLTSGTDITPPFATKADQLKPIP